MRIANKVWTIGLIVAAVSLAGFALGQDQQAARAQEAQPAAPGAAPGAGGAPPKYPPFADVVKEATTVEGLLRMHHKGNRLLVEISPAQLEREFIVLISIARGIGKGQLLGGMSWGFGDDWLWQFRKVDERMYIVRRNTRFRAAGGSPEEKAVKLAYTDSVLFSLPIVTMSPSGAFVVDMTGVFMSDLPQISATLPGFGFAPDKSSWAQVKGFKDNVELQVAATYASGGNAEIDSVADSRGVTLNIHYSISLLPQTGYQSRLADDRVGYFLSVVKDYSKKGDEDRFVRYINRWDLRKADASAELSPPVKPVIFWLEKTIPFVYRKPIREGILEWNKAFEKAGFANAIEVRQQPDNADWDPEDINYNTFRWITASAGFAMGPSRVNPHTGQILDADIIFDADFLNFWKQEFETFTPASVAAMTGGPLDLESFAKAARVEHDALGHRHDLGFGCELSHGMSSELALGAAVFAARAATPVEREKLIAQGLKEVTMHEVGHTLGLRHNFKSSSMYTLEEINDVNKTKDTGLTGSVMDYSPANLVPMGATQGDYYSTTIGPYDLWAIEYGYKPLAGGTEGEVAELKKIAARSGEPALAYATDEDTRGIDSDPLSNRFDLGKDVLAYAKMRAQLVSEVLPKMINEVTKDGDGYQRARQAFGILLKTHGQSMHFVSRFIGGVYLNRSHKGDPNGQAPFVVVDPGKQREALALLEEQVFNDKPFSFPPEMYNYLASSRWSHWGSDVPARGDFAVHQTISMWQDRILQQLLSSLTLERIHDAELKVAADQDALTVPELLERLSKAIFSELDKMPQGDYTVRKPAISSLRRNLQRSYVRRISQIALGETAAAEDCETVAFAEVTRLEGQINNLLKTDIKFDPYSRAHLQETAARLHKVTDARLQLPRL